MKLLVQGSAFGVMPHYIAAAGTAHASTLGELLALLEEHSVKPNCAPESFQPDGGLRARLHLGLRQPSAAVALANPIHKRQRSAALQNLAAHAPVPGQDARAIDLVGLRQYFDRRPDGKQTCFQGAKLLPAGFDLYCDDNGNLRCRGHKLPEANGALLPLLEKVLGELLALPRRIAVALSGGLDSALVLALVRRVTGKSIPIVTLATGLPGYCELEQTLETARLLGIEVEVIEVDAEEFVSALPDAIAACETPLFNLHPVSKLLLARSLARRGYDAVLTGDGADQVFAGSDARNYLPIVGAMVRATGLAFLSPFFDEWIVSWARCHGTDSEKTALREAASAVLPTELVWGKKSPRLAPDFDLERHRDPQLETILAPGFGLNPSAALSGPQQTLWATTAILVRHLGGTC